ncbi:MAG: ABC transporter permease subunit [Actinomycetota bacterium]
MSDDAREGSAATSAPPVERRKRSWAPLLFLAPALVLLGAIVVYPIFFSVGRSLFDASGGRFVGLDNYQEMFSAESTRTAIKNNLIWVVFAPSIVTAVGLVFAVLTERIKWSTAFKVAIFMPMAISFLSAGVTWRLIYEQDPDIGLANATVGAVVNVFRPPGVLPGARPSQEDAFRPVGDGSLEAADPVDVGGTVGFGLVAIPPEQVPEGAVQAVEPAARDDGIAGVVWLDFAPGGGGEPGGIDTNELGLPGVDVEAVSGGEVVTSATTGPDGTFVLEGVQQGAYEVRLPSSNFREPFGGLTWLGPTLVTPAIIVSYIWIWAGFAMVVIAAGLAAIPRETLEASRVDGANEWQVFRRVTVPLLAPLLAVVLVTLVINVLKIFDLVLVIAPGSAQRDANVIALQLWKTAFGIRDFGLGSALAVFLLLLVVPAMAFNIRRFRAEQS